MNKNLKNKRIRQIPNSVFPFLLFLIISLIATPVLAQLPEMTPGDLKKLEKAEEIKEEAEELQIRANELYLEASVIQQDEEYDISKKLQKEAEKLEKKALSNEEDAAKLFEESTSIRKDIYKSAIEQFWKNFEGEESDYINAKLIEETADEYFFRAEEIRKDASKMKNDKEAILKQNEAYELELMALEKISSAYNIYKYGPSGIVTYPEEVPVDDESTDESLSLQNEIPENQETAAPEEQITAIGEQVTPEEGEVNVNQQQLEMIMGHLDRREANNDSAANFHPEELITGYDMESVRKSWEEYKGMDLPEAPSDQSHSSSTLSEEPAYDESKEEQVSEVNSPEEIAEEPADESSPEIEIGRVEENIIPDPNSTVIYKVQLAADRAPISQNVLKKLYYGDHDIERITEDGWYKYSIGDFDTFEEADQYRRSLRVDDAFVVAYRGSKRVKDYANETVEEITSIKEKPESETIPTPPVINNKIEYVVQIAASKSPMQNTQLNRIYNGNKEIKMRQEEGWYKYQIGHTNSLNEAKETLRSTNVNGSFIAAYREDKKINPGYSNRINTNARDNSIIFKVQIAANKSPLAENELNEIYNGNQEINEIREEGWYKYQIDAGTTYNDARRLKNLLKINGSFVVAYQNGNKLNIRRAIEMTKQNE